MDEPAVSPWGVLPRQYFRFLWKKTVLRPKLRSAEATSCSHRLALLLTIVRSKNYFPSNFELSSPVCDIPYSIQWLSNASLILGCGKISLPHLLRWFPRLHYRKGVRVPRWALRARFTGWRYLLVFHLGLVTSHMLQTERRINSKRI